MKLFINNCLDCPAYWRRKGRCRITHSSCKGKILPKECPLFKEDAILTLVNDKEIRPEKELNFEALD